MKKFIFTCAVFLLIWAVPVLIISQFDNLDKSTSKDINVGKLRSISQWDSLDILFLGNSYTYCGINNNLFDSLGLRTFNFGLATSGPYFYDIALDEYQSNNSETPKLLMVLISPIMFSSKADNFSYYPVHRYLSEPISNERIAWKYNEIGAYSSMLKRSLQKAYKHFTEDEITSDPDENYDPGKKGFVAHLEVNTDKKEKDALSFYGPLEKEELREKKAFFLKEWALRQKKNGLKIVFYELPENHLRNYFSSHFLSDYANLKMELEKDFLVLAIRLQLPNEYFLNVDHLNLSGANLATRALIEEMTRNAIIGG